MDAKKVSAPIVLSPRDEFDVTDISFDIKMDYEGQDSFLDSRGDKKQPSVQRPVQVMLLELKFQYK